MLKIRFKILHMYLVPIIMLFIIVISFTSCVSKDSDIANTNPEEYHTKEELGIHFEDENFRCDDCHKVADYGVRDCFSCHDIDYNDSTSTIYDHNENIIAKNCEDCHSMLDFSFDYDYHDVDSNLNNKNISCIECHRFDFIDKNNWTDHPLNNLSESCEACHDTISWFNLTYEHETLIIGEIHEDPNNVYGCLSCHMNDYIDNSDNCSICHLGEEEDNLIHESFIDEKVSDCYSCHKDLDDWTVQEQVHTTFNINTNHLENECFECHLGMPPEQQGMICFNCHYEDFYANHDDSEDKECLNCHTAVAFK